MAVNLNTATRATAQQAGFGAALKTDLQRGGADAAATLRQLRDYIHDADGHLRAGDIRIVNTTNDKSLAFSFKSFGWGHQYRKDRTAEALTALLERAGVADAQQRVDQLLKPDGAQAYGRLSAARLDQLLSSVAVKSVLDGQPAAPQSPAASAQPNTAELKLQALRAELDQLLKGGGGVHQAPPERLDAYVRQAPTQPIQVPQQPAPAAPPKPAAPALDPNQPPRAQAETFLSAHGYTFAPGPRLGAGAFGSTFLAKFQGQDQVVKLFIDDKKNVFKDEVLKGNRHSGKSSELYASYLLRSGSHPNWQAPNLIAPSAYIVRSDRPEGFESIPVGEIKARARRARGGLKCVGLIMAKAPGLGFDAIIANRGLSAADAARASKSGLQTLRALNDRGFIHRDIKPANMNYDAATGKLHFFDTGALFKTRKSGQSGSGWLDKHKRVSELPEPGGGTRAYAEREWHRDKRRSSQGDLHALTLSLLQARFPSLHPSILIQAQTDRPYVDASTLAATMQTLTRHSNPQVQRDANAFIADMHNGNSYAHFIATALNIADSRQIPASDWANRQVSNQHLEALMEHPSLQ